MTQPVPEIFAPAVSHVLEGSDPARGRSQTMAAEAFYGAQGHTSLGVLLVVVSRRGIRAMLLGADPTALWAEAEQRLGTTLRGSHNAMATRALQAAAAVCEAPHEPFALPLDVRGTPFQRRVWQALCEIPAGTTLSYGALAARLGSPFAVRAAASACAANAHAVVIPCHRVVRQNGALSGYRWGLPIKAELLRREARASGAHALACTHGSPSPSA